MASVFSFNRALKIGSWSLLTTFSVVALCIGLALSSIGTKWAIDFVNEGDFGVVIDYKRGSFYSQVELNQIQIRQTGLDIIISNLSLDIGLGCLFTAQLCIDHLRLDDIDIAVGDMPTTEAEVDEREDRLISLPILLTLQELSIGQLRVSQQNAELLKLEALLLALSFHQTLDITRLSVDALTVSLNAEGEQALARNEKTEALVPRAWLDTLLAYQYKPVEIPTVYIPVELSLKNAALRNICVRKLTQEQSYLNLLCNDTATVKLAIQKQKLDTSIILNGVKPDASDALMSPTDIEFNAKIDFAQNFEHKIILRTSLNKDTPISSHKLGFEIESKGNIKQFNLRVRHTPTQQSILSLVSSIEPSFALLPVTTDLQFNQLSHNAVEDLRAWLPGFSDEIFSQLTGVSLLRVKVSGDMQGYRLSGSVNTKQIMGVERVDVNANVRPMGDAQNVRKLLELDTFSIKGGIGNVDFAGQAVLSQQQGELEWEGTLTLEDLQLSEIEPSLASRISGSVPHNITLSKTTQSGSINNTNLSGTWQNLPLSLVADAELEKNGNLKVSTLHLTQGKNKIAVQGDLYSSQALDSIAQLGLSFAPSVTDKNSSLDFMLDIQALSSLYPALDGAVAAKGNISGAIEAPKIVMQASVDSFTSGDAELENATMDISIDMLNKLASKADIAISNLSTGGENIPRVELQIYGDEDQQTMRLAVPEGDVTTEQFFEGKLNEDSTVWSGRWLKGNVVSDLAEISLQSEPELVLHLAPLRLHLANHCWAGRGDQLCIADTQLTQQAATTKLLLDYNVMNAGMVNYLSTFDIERSALDLNVNIDVHWSAQDGVQFSADLYSQDASFVSDEAVVDIQNIAAKVEGSAQEIKSHFTFMSTDAGNIVLNSKLGLSNKPYQHGGNIEISDFSVSYFSSFIAAVNELNGNINADIMFSGPLEKPSLQGELSLADGAVVLNEFPLRLADYNQNVTFDGFAADFTGQFTLGEGTGSVAGNVDFTERLILNSMIKGDKLDIAYESYRFQVSPELKIQMRPELLSVSGNVDIPWARVKIKSLPPSAKSPTQDIIVIDETEIVQQSSVPLDIKVNVLIDEGKKGEVQLDALDLKAQLSGDLAVHVDTQNTKVNGIVQILKGDYKAYSQVLQIRKGDITFSGQPDVPAFDIEAIRNPLNTKDDVIAGIWVSGNAIKPSVELFSEPSMEQSRQLSYLISGFDIFNADTNSGSSESTSLVNALVSYGVGKSENGIGSLGQSLGVKDLNIQTAGQEGETQVQLSGQLAEGVKITYGIGVFDSVSEVSVHYQLLPQLYLEAVSGANNTLDLYYEITSKD